MKLFACICVVFLLQSILSCGHGLNCDSLPMPKSYVVYFLQNGEEINIDGKLDDYAWQEVSRSDRFIGKYAYRYSCELAPVPPRTIESDAVLWSCSWHLQHDFSAHNAHAHFHFLIFTNFGQETRDQAKWPSIIIFIFLKQGSYIIISYVDQ